MTNETEHRNPIDILSEEFLDRRRRGESLSVSEFAASHPGLAEKIQRLFPAMIALEQCKSTRLSTSASSRPVDLQIDAPEQLGDFRIVREIGRGGMGVVYEAQQQSLQRRVAVKVFPRQALRDSKHLDRFHREAKTAARLHHTNIVPVFGVGNQDSLHYFVMQRIDGISLDDVIQECAAHLGQNLKTQANVDTNRDRVSEAAVTLSQIESCGQDGGAAQSNANHANTGRIVPSATKFRTPVEVLHHVPPRCEDWFEILDRSGQSLWCAVANVGIQVADALEYAHVQGVLHRDIKPSNLLLDPQGTVWVTDFGLATALEAEQGAPSEEVAGTLRFMAPEHIRGTQDTRSDIYSLGLTLYELLTLRPAFDDVSRTMMLSKIMKGSIPPPRERRPEIPKDLDAIVVKAMARDSEDRYASAADLGSDLRRFVQGRPVSARPISAPLKLWRWTARNPVVASLGTALLLTAITSFFVVGAKWKDAVAENQRAEDNLSLALESLDQILMRFTSSWMAHPIAIERDDADLETESLDLQMAVSDHSAAVLQDALEFYDRFAEQNPTNPQLYRDIAKVHRRVADIFQRLGQHGKAEEAYRRSLGFLNAEQIVDDSSLALERVETLNQLGFSLYSASRFVEAEREFRRALDLVAAVPEEELASQARVQEARIRTNLAQCLSLMFRWSDARESQQTALGILEELVQDSPNQVAHRLELARASRSYYRLTGYRKDDSSSTDDRDREQIRTAGIQILEDLVREYPNVPDYRCELSELLATKSSRKRNSKSSRIELDRAVKLARELDQSHPAIPRYRLILARALMTQADCQCDKELDEADRLFDEPIALFRSLTRTFPDMPVYRVFLVRALRDQAETFSRLQRFDDACSVMQKAVEEQTHYVQLRPDNHYGEQVLSRLKGNLEKLRHKRDSGEEQPQRQPQEQRG